MSIGDLQRGFGTCSVGFGGLGHSVPLNLASWEPGWGPGSASPDSGWHLSLHAFRRTSADVEVDGWGDYEREDHGDQDASNHGDGEGLQHLRTGPKCKG